MKRFNVENITNGLKFSIEADALPDPMPPEWGQNPDIEEEDITQEISDRVADQSKRQDAIAKLKVLKKKPTFTQTDKDNILRHLVDMLL